MSRWVESLFLVLQQILQGVGELSLSLSLTTGLNIYCIIANGVYMERTEAEVSNMSVKFSSSYETFSSYGKVTFRAGPQTE